VARSGVVRALVAAVAISALAGSTASAAVEYETETEGVVAVSWRGDPAQGCEAAGVCDLSGSVVVRPGSGSSGEFSGPGGLEGDLATALETLEPDGGLGTARVLRGPPDAPDGACSDLVPGSLRVEAASTGRPTDRQDVTLFPLRAPGPAAIAGRCPGPLASDLVAALPKTSIDPRSLVRGTTRIDLSGRGTFSGGGYSGEVVSSLVLTRRSRRIADDDDDTSRRSSEEGDHGVRVVSVTLRYAIEAGAAGIVTRFAGAESPFCLAFDACGVTGVRTLEIGAGRRGRLDLNALGRVRGGRSKAAALRAIRSGRLEVQGFVPSFRREATAATTTSRDGTPACRETAPVELPGLHAATSRRALTLAIGSEPYEQDAGDPLRGRCGGPSVTDLAGAELLAARIPLRRLGARRIDVGLRSPRALPGGFTIESEGALPLTLRLRSLDVRVTRVPKDFL
jgi:hypothetical protein